MNSPTIRQCPNAWQAPERSPASTNACQHGEACQLEADTERDQVASSATGTLSALPPGDRFTLSLAEAGQMLGLSRAFAYELAARGELPTIRLGRRVMIPKVALLAMVGLSPLQS
jgi:excisionase family DNA binding protein